MEKLISLCMIVKDEEKLLRRCLESVKDMVDEIVIVDTGSSDRTMEIAREYTSRLFEFAWNNDFSAAKNEAIRRATGKWILFLDADEYVQPNDHDKLRTFLASLNADEPIGYVLTIMNFTGNFEHDKNRMIESTAARLFPNHPDLYYTRPIHEQLTARNGNLRLHKYPFIIFHTGYTAEVRQNKEKSARNLAIFESLKNKTKLEPYDCFTLANEYQTIRNYEKALYYYKKAYMRARPSDGWYSFCLDRMIQTLFSLERYKEADDLINNGLERWNDFADYHCLKGMLLDHFGFRENARREFEQCIQLADKAEKKQSRFWLISPDYGRLIPYKKLAEIHGCRQDLPQTVYYLSKVLQQKPKDTACLYQISELLAAHEDGPSVAGFFAKIYPTQNPLHAKLLFQIFTLIGHADLSDHYYNQCLRNNMEPEPADLLRYHLLTRNHAKYNKLLQRYPELKNNENLIEYFHIAAMVWQDESYLPAPMPEAQNNDETSFHLSLLIHLYQLKMFEQFDQILTQVSSPALIHQLADYFYAHHQSELAVDYYLYLFDRGELQANGLRNIGIFYVNRGQLAEGLHFLRGCLEMNPQDCALYGMILSITDDQQLKEQIKQQFTERFPAIKNLSFMQQA